MPVASPLLRAERRGFRVDTLSQDGLAIPRMFFIPVKKMLRAKFFVAGCFAKAKKEPLSGLFS